MTSWPDRPVSSRSHNVGAVLTLLPISTTVAYYGLPISLQELLLIQFIPQVLAYVALGLWAMGVSHIRSQLGLGRDKIGNGLRWGVVTGLLLGGLNTFVILSIYPSLGYDITFLKQTLHGRLPVWLMVPWFISCIAFFVEVNFRGFLLGRLAEIESHWWGHTPGRNLAPFALIVSTFTFAFDPFMVNTFRHLHWIALWDGLIWGCIWLRTRNLWMTIVAHGLEVIVLYSAVKAAIG